MNCPVCECVLKPKRYSGARIFQCEKCRGHLVDQHRVTTIEKRLDKDLPHLVNQAVSHQEDTAESIRCPRCRGRMDKQPIRSISREVNQDVCRNCDAIWFDGGELAEIQLAFEANAQTLEVKRMRERIENMSPAEKAEYERRIGELREVGGVMSEAIGQATEELVAYYYFRSYRLF